MQVSSAPRLHFMAQVVDNEFWRSPAVLEPAAETALPAQPPDMAEACADCGSEYLIGASFCHTCGVRRPLRAELATDAEVMSGIWIRRMAWVQLRVESAAAYWRKISFPDWLHYLHFHEIKRWVGLPTAALIAFIIGMGCAAGAIGVSLFYKASNLAEFQAIQMWRIEWLLAATASFVAGILLKKPSDNDSE
jgi:hypothetical protein